jgi:hypothetical protein
MTILIVRSQLWLTNYPQLGGGNLHIAHLLWGGLLMLIAIGLLLSFVGRSLRTPAALLGGVGFGLFIDEVGKFVTADNDYSFKPTAAIIYVVFVVLFLSGRAIQRRRGLEPREYLVNALDALTEGARRQLDNRERNRALELLRHADPSEPLVEPVRMLLERTPAAPARRPGRLARIGARSRAAYHRLVERPRFGRALGWFFTAWALFSLLAFVLLALGTALKLAASPKWTWTTAVPGSQSSTPRALRPRWWPAASSSMAFGGSGADGDSSRTDRSSAPYSCRSSSVSSSRSSSPSSPRSSDSRSTSFFW